LTNDPNSQPSLNRAIGPFELTLYALGSMLGSGIYALIGKAAGVVGNAVWLSFVAALCAALLTALSYASLGSRYPRAGGASYVTDRAFGWPILSFAVGLALVCSGMTSVATQSRVFASNLASVTGMTSIPVEALALGFLLITAGIVFRGIRESMWVNVVCTLIEAAGLLIVIAVSFSYWGSVDYFETPASTLDGSTALLILQGSILTFFAFIGFEDTYNVAEEVKNPETTIPIALATAMLLATVLYIAVAISAVSVVPYQELSAAPAPLAAVMERAAPAFPAVVLVAITMFAVANTALVNYVTASRMLYGMSNQGLLPPAVARVHPTRQTPHIAILILFALLTPLMLSANVSELAAATVLLLLFTFAIVNAALFVLKRRPGEQEGRFEIPAWVPALGCLLCIVLIVVRVASGDIKAPIIAGALIAGILGLYWLLARQKEAPQT
jgi:basic amino acid/polyamine antiporter, APA family